ncbi:unnamed protein product [Zymoseptoria tritici ST99CH_1E4]|uniref:Alpha-1,3-mannosyltransferase n=1 Tax=Zymoseptoria tritici ST99CH_1E4 TaxID=1276532 RepID=A0A2H1FN12_ZYMTR|nr:unnamed protein product [Zymoseptoria tritici ST99CH_1E4]
MHYLHPRSRTTGTLFTTTLAVSFIVVALPHLLPCPVDRRQFADSYETPDGKIRRRRKRKDMENEKAGESGSSAVGNAAASEDPPQRECPIPKPGGIVGQIMGFKNEERPRPTEVIVQKLSARSPPRSGQQNQNDSHGAS